jgi:hypothetical protein
MREFSIAAVVATNLLIGVRYCWLIRQDRIRPALAMWVFFTIATVASLLTYLAEGEYGLLDNILNTADIGLVGVVSIWIAVFGHRSARFTRFDVGCLVAVLLIVAGWAVTRQHVAAHVLIQAIMAIGYLPVIRRMWAASRNTESFVVFAGLLIAPIFSLLSSRGALATLYAVRAMACTGGLLILMARLEWRARRAR